MNIFTSQKDLKKWAIAMANACGGQEVSQTSIKLNKPNAKNWRRGLDRYRNSDFSAFKFITSLHKQYLEA